jgi:hypothetical protein
MVPVLLYQYRSITLPHPIDSRDEEFFLTC